MSPRGHDADDDEEDDETRSSLDAVALPITDTLDLHTFPPRDVADLVREWIGEARAAGFREVRIIHGRGIGVQREIVRAVLGRDPRVAEFGDAPPESGGWGATWARFS